MTVQIAELDPSTAANVPETPELVPVPILDLGVAVAEITPEIRQNLGIPPQVTGIFVVSVRPEGSAAEMGLRSGDIIEAINNVEVTTPDELARAVRTAQAAGRGSVLLLLNSLGNRRLVGVSLGRA